MLHTVIEICFWNEMGGRNFDPRVHEVLYCFLYFDKVFLFGDQETGMERDFKKIILGFFLNGCLKILP